MWVNALSPMDIAEFLRDSYPFDAKTGRAYTQILMRLRVFGSLPFNDKSLAAIAGCTANFWRKRAWPELQELFEIRNGRLLHPEVQSRRSLQSVPDAEDSPSARRKAAAQVAANSRWGNRPVLSMVTEQDDISQMRSHDASSMRTHPAAHDISMPCASDLHAENGAFASENHAQNAAFASPDASDAYAPASAPSLSPEDSFFPDSVEKTESPLRERADARAPAHDASDASGDASAHASDAPSDASTHASAPPAVSAYHEKTLMTPDWQPSQPDIDYTVGLGHDSATIAAELAKFRYHHIDKGERRSNWSALWRKWLNQPWLMQRRQRHMTMAVPGGAAAATPSTEAPEETDPADPVAAKLKAEFGANVYRTWLRKMVFGDPVDDDGDLVVTLPTAFDRDYVRREYGDRLTALLRAEDPAIVRLRFEVAAPVPRVASG